MENDQSITKAKASCSSYHHANTPIWTIYFSPIRTRFFDNGVLILFSVFLHETYVTGTQAIAVVFPMGTYNVCFRGEIRFKVSKVWKTPIYCRPYICLFSYRGVYWCTYYIDLIMLRKQFVPKANVSYWSESHFRRETNTILRMFSTLRMFLY